MILMKFDNTFSITDIISVCALLATLVTVILLLVQRHDAAKPYVTVRAETHGKSASYFRSGHIVKLNENALILSAFGSNPARDVTIDTKLILDRPREFYKSIHFTRGNIHVIERNNEMITFANPKETFFDVVSPNEKIDFSQYIAGMIHTSLLCIYDAFSQKTKTVIPCSEPVLICKIIYYDFLGKKFTNYLKIQVKFSQFNNTRIDWSFKSRTMTKKKYNKLCQNFDFECFGEYLK